MSWWFKPACTLLCLAALLLPSAARAQSRKDLVKVPIVDVPAGDKQAIVVGVGGYKQARSLSLSVKDAKAFAAFLQQKMGFAPGSVTLMTDDAPEEAKKPTYVNLRGALRHLTEGVDSNKVVLVFFSGHGVNVEGQDWLVPSDGDPDDVEGTCISATFLVNQLQVKQPRRALLFFDACRSIVKGNEVRGADFGISTKALGAPELAVLYSCQPKEVSVEGQGDIQQGVFTHFALQALSGDPEAADESGNVTYDSLVTYLRTSVNRYAKQRFGIEQHPIGYSTEGAMVLARAAKAVRPADDPAGQDAAALVQEAYRLLIRIEDSSPAAAKAREAIARDPKNALAHAILGDAKANLRDLTEAKKELDLALELDPNCAMAYLGYGDLHLAESRRDEAERAYVRAIELGPEIPFGYYELADIQYDKGRFVEAERGYRKSIYLYAAAGLDYAYLHSSLGWTLYSQHRYAEAEKALKRSLELEANNLLGHNGLGAVYTATERYEAAEREYFEAIALRPTEPVLRDNLGKSYWNQGRYSQAEQEFRKAVELDPKNAAFQADLADTYRAQKRYPEAEAAYRRALELNPKYAYAYDKLGDCYWNQERYPAAEQQYRKAAESDPDNASYHSDLGDACRMQKNLDEAEAAYRRALALDPDHERGHNGLGMVLYVRGKYGGAEKEFRRVVAMSPKTAAYHSNLGDALYYLERYDDAIAEYREAIRLDPDNKTYQQSLEETIKKKNGE